MPTIKPDGPASNSDRDLGPIQALYDEGETLSEQSRRAILSLGREATDPLVAILSDEALWDEEAPGDGWAPIHAAEILGQLGDPDAIGPMYDALFECEPDAVLDTALTDALRGFGAEAIRPGIEALERHGDAFRDDLACVFSGLGVRKKVIFQVLVKDLVQSPIIGAANLVEYGDPKALDALVPMLHRLLMDAAEDRSKAEMALAVSEAIEELGGEITDNQREQLDILRDKKGHAHEVLRRVKQGIGDHHHPDTHVNEHDVGRNDPCWCGSGRKYKHCHWKEDQQ